MQNLNWKSLSNLIDWTHKDCKKPWNLLTIILATHWQKITIQNKYPYLQHCNTSDLNNIFFKILDQCRIQMYFGTIWMVWVSKKCTQKSSGNFFPYIFQVKPKRNIVYKYLKTKIYSRYSNIFPQMHWISNIFGHSATIIGSFWILLIYPVLNLIDT